MSELFHVDSFCTFARQMGCALKMDAVPMMRNEGVPFPFPYPCSYTGLKRVKEGGTPAWQLASRSDPPSVAFGSVGKCCDPAPPRTMTSTSEGLSSVARVEESASDEPMNDTLESSSSVESPMSLGQVSVHSYEVVDTLPTAPKNEPWKQRLWSPRPTAPPRELNEWGQTICGELLKTSRFLLVCDIEGGNLKERARALVRCTGSVSELHWWTLEILAGPLSLLSLRDTSIRCNGQRHFSDDRSSHWNTSIDALVITKCLHPCQYRAALEWKNIVQASFVDTSLHVIGTAMAKWCMETWQTPVMEESLKRMQDELSKKDFLLPFRLDSNQRGFFGRAGGRNGIPMAI